MRIGRVVSRLLNGCVLAALGAVVGSTASGAGAFRAADVRVTTEDAEFSVPVLFTHEDAVSAATAILDADRTAFEIIDARADGNAAAPEWHLATLQDTWAALSWILDFAAPYDGQTLPAGAGQEIARFVCRLEAGLTPRTAALTLPAGPRGAPALFNIYVADTADVFPDVAGGTLTIAPPYVTVDSITVERRGSVVTLTVAGEGFADGCEVLIDGAAVPFTRTPDGALIIADYACEGAAEHLLRVCRGAYCGEKSFFCATVFVRGDANDDGSVDIGDAVRILSYLFSGAAVRCRDAADANDDGALDIADAIYVLAYLFARGKPPAEPFRAPGVDATADRLECAAYTVRGR